MNEATEKQPVENQKPSGELTAQDLNNVTGGNIVQNIVRGALAPAKEPTESTTLNYSKTNVEL
jgi:hypothetical protein